MRDWNHDGKIDNKDRAMDYHIFEETNKTNGNSYYGGTGRSGGSGVLKGTVITIVVLILLAFVLGVGIPGAVWGFFGKVILVVGFFTLLGKIFR